jgi:hypothetical protein
MYVADPFELAMEVALAWCMAFEVLVESPNRGEEYEESKWKGE